MRLRRQIRREVPLYCLQPFLEVDKTTLGYVFKGKRKHVAYGLSPVLEQSLSSPESSFLREECLEEAGGHARVVVLRLETIKERF